MQSQTKTGPKPQKKIDAEKCKVTFLHGCFSSPAWRSHHCLCPSARDNEWMTCAFSGPSDLGKLHVALSESGRHFSAPYPHHLFAPTVSCSCLWVYPFWPGRFNPNALESLCCIMPAGIGPGQIHGGKQKIFQRKTPTSSFLGSKPGSDLHLWS